MGVRSQNGKITRTMKMKALKDNAVATKKKTGKPLSGGLWREPGGVYSVFILEDVASDKRLGSDSVISSAVAFKDCSIERLDC